METKLIVGICVALLLALIRRPLLDAVRVPTPGGAILLMSFLYVFGAAVEVLQDESSMAAFVFAVSIVLFSIYTVSFFAFSRFLNLTLVPKTGILEKQFERSLRRRTIAMLFVAALCTAAAIVFVTGADRVLTALFQFLAYGQVDISVLDLRLGLATGEERWVAPGYTKQVRDIVLPLTALLLLYGMKWRVATFLLLSFSVVPVVSILMISTGERAPLVLFFVGVLYGAKRCIEWNLQTWRAIAFPLALVGTLALGAFHSLTSSFTSREQDDVSTVLIFADRIVTRAPEENILSAPIWLRGAPYPGASWLQELASVMPGAQAALSNLLHEDLGGGDRGNSVLGMWVDVYYNFGWMLGVPVAFLLGLGVALFNHWVNANRAWSRTTELIGMWLSICMLLTLSPFGFVLYGPFTLSVLLFLAGKLARRTRPNAQATRVAVGAT